jgi:hypothetical protein
MSGATVTGDTRVEGPPRHRAHAAAMAAGRAAGVVAVIVLATVAGIGWLNLLRHTGVLAIGPRLHEALPLQRLAHNGAQPVGRIFVAWLPAGLGAGAALIALGLGSRAARAAVVFAGCAVLLLALGDASDSISESDPLSTHLAQQPHRIAIWLAATLAAAGSATWRARR